MALVRRLLRLGVRWALAGRRRRPRVEAELRHLVHRLVVIGPGRTRSLAERGTDSVPGVTRITVRPGGHVIDLPADGIHPAERVELGPRAVHRFRGVAHGGTGLAFVDDAMVAESGGVTQSRGRLAAVHWIPNEYRGLVAAGALDAAVSERPLLPLGRPLGRNYFHWLLESLPSVLRGIEVVPDAAVLVPTDVPGFVLRSLAVLGVDVLRDDGYHAADLVVVDPSEINWPHPADLDLLVASVDTALGPTAAGSPARVYVTRRRDERALRGEAELEERLAAVGFTVFAPGAWEDDMSLFRRAELVVGPHGAGLANAVVARPGVRLVELSTARFRNSLFRRLAAIRGLMYDHIDLASTAGAPDGDADDAWQALRAPGGLELE